MRDEQPFLLDHHWMLSQNRLASQRPGDVKQKIQLTDKESAALDEALRGSRTIRNYQDPLADVDSRYSGDWLAAVSEVPSTGWIAIVQERRSEAVAPMYELRSIFIRYGQLMIVVFVAMLVLLGLFIRRLIQL